MERSPVTIPVDTTLREAADEYLMRRREDGFLVRRDGHSMGVLTLSDLKRVAVEERPSRFVANVMEDIDHELSMSRHAIGGGANETPDEQSGLRGGRGGADRAPDSRRRRPLARSPKLARGLASEDEFLKG